MIPLDGRPSFITHFDIVYVASSGWMVSELLAVRVSVLGGVCWALQAMQENRIQRIKNEHSDFFIIKILRNLM